ncbi:MAG: hypothetical protein O3B01_22835 [Planctomycetota bacterium]|nr:hypothetical protein [Planctomycetota bacterium]
MEQLRKILLKPILDNERTRRYQEVIDKTIDEFKKNWDLERGMIGTVGLELPHEADPNYWDLSEEDRAGITSEEAHRAYRRAAGRGGTAPLCAAAFAWHSHLSRHHHDPDIVRFFENGLKFFTGTIGEDGVLAMHGLNGLVWAHGWDLEGLIYGLVFLWDEMNTEVRDAAIARLRKSGERFFAMGSSGTHGNQGCVQALGLFLYGELLDMPEAIEASNQRWKELAPMTLDNTGQVIEQYGPCMHYSYTCFIYAWINAFLRNGDGQEDRIEKCLDWFRYRHTESLYPMPGPSSRGYYESIKPKIVDIIPALEELSVRKPYFQKFIDSIWGKIGDAGAGGIGHGGSTMMWAILACPGIQEAKPSHRTEWEKPFEEYYEYIDLFGKSPLAYLLVKREYQTTFNIRDFLPFSGIQTWSWGDEPPIIHPTKLAPSTTQAWGLDTARQGVSNNWGLFGAGAFVVDAKFKLGLEQGKPSLMVSRYDHLWRILVFTDASTLILEFGKQGPRKTLWTLNRLEPAEPNIGDGQVTFKGRKAVLYSTIQTPTLNALGPGEWTEGVQVLEYDCGQEFCAFAFSGGPFEFITPRPTEECVYEFKDVSGRYRLALASGFFAEDNPGNCTLNRQVLTDETTLERVS